MKTKYHELNVPLNPSPYPEGISPLNLLYPGRPMTIYDSPDRTNIPNEDEEGMCCTNEKKRQDTLKYAANLERMARLAGGGDKNKVMARPAVAPDEMIEDPSLVGLSLIPEPRATNFPAPPPIRSSLNSPPLNNVPPTLVNVETKIPNHPRVVEVSPCPNCYSFEPHPHSFEHFNGTPNESTKKPAHLQPTDYNILIASFIFLVIIVIAIMFIYHDK